MRHNDLPSGSQTDEGRVLIVLRCASRFICSYPAIRATACIEKSEHATRSTRAFPSSVLAILFGWEELLAGSVEYLEEQMFCGFFATGKVRPVHIPKSGPESGSDPDDGFCVF